VRHTAVRSALVIVALLLVTQAPAAADADTDDEERWERLIQRAIDAAEEHPYAGRLVVVSFEEGGPSLGEIAVARTEDGTVMSNPTRSWMVGMRAHETVLADVEAGRLFRLGTAQRGTFSVAQIRRNYEVEVEDRDGTILGIGAVVVALTARGSRTLRERLHIDPGTGLVLRRETFDGEEEPFRLVAYTALDLGADEVPEVGSGWIEQEVERVRTDVSARGIEVFRGMGWVVPRELEGGFRLTDVGAVGHSEGEESSLHLLYSDGLYALSVYEQQGRLDDDAVREAGARRIDLGGIQVHRWPGSEPAVMTWTAEDMTFTVVSDAPPDVLAAALAVFPHESPARFTDRVRRGVSRTLDVLWPFG
jgi:hypothetical protein